jgi:hypothetical protein
MCSSKWRKVLSIESHILHCNEHNSSLKRRHQLTRPHRRGSTMLRTARPMRKGDTEGSAGMSLVLKLGREDQIHIGAQI